MTNFKFLKDTFHLLEPERRRKYISLVVAKSFFGLLDVAGIAIIGIVGAFIVSRNSNSSNTKVLGFEVSNISENQTILIGIFILIFFIFKSTMSILLVKRLSLLLSEIDSQKSEDITQIFFSEGNYLSKYNKSEIHWATNDSVTQAFSTSLFAFSSVISETFVLLLTICLLLTVSLFSSLWVIAYLSAVLLIIYFIVSKKLARTTKMTVVNTISTYDAVDNFVSAFKEISVSNVKPHFFQQIAVPRKKVAIGRNAQAFLGSLPRNVTESALVIGVIAFAGIQLSSGNFAESTAILGVFLLGGLRIMSSAIPLQNSISSLKSSAIQGEAARTLLYSKKDFQTNSFDPRVDYKFDSGYEINITNLCFTHANAEHQTLKNITLTIPQNSFTAVIGPSGAGKTTFVDIVLGLLTPDSGEILIGGNNPKYVLTSGQPRIAYVPQNPKLISGTLLENIALGISFENIDFKRVNDALEMADLKEFTDSLPEGLYTNIGDITSTLSGGQAQRVGLARAIYVNPQILVLDEATSSLDAKSEAHISTKLYDSNNYTIIVVAHRLNTIQHADKVVVFQDGEILAEGTFNYLAKNIELVKDFIKHMDIHKNE